VLFTPTLFWKPFLAKLVLESFPNNLRKYFITSYADILKAWVNSALGELVEDLDEHVK
jgi:hypothetical protein